MAAAIRQGGLGIAGGSPGVNSAVETDNGSGYAAIILSNYIAALAFTILHFNRAKGPLLLTLLGIGLCAYGVYALADVTVGR